MKFWQNRNNRLSWNGLSSTHPDYYPVLGWMSIDDNNQTTINAIIQLNGSSPNFICLNTGINHHFSVSSYFLFFSLRTIFSL